MGSLQTIGIPKANPVFLFSFVHFPRCSTQDLQTTKATQAASLGLQALRQNRRSKPF